MRYRTNEEDVSVNTTKKKARYRTNEEIESISSKDAKAAGDIVLGTLFMNPAKVARGVSAASGKEMSEDAKKAVGWLSKVQGVDIGRGFFGAAEGITDFLAGGAAQLVGQKDAAKWIYNHSWSQDATGTDVTDEFVGDAAETKGYRLASDLLSGFGNVGFQIAVGTLIGGALSAPLAEGTISATSAKAIQYAPLFMSASGSGTAENMQKTGELGWRENVGGLLKGGVEVLTEIVSPTGRITEAALFGKNAKGMSRYLVKHAVAKNIITNFAGEAGEEALSYVGDHYIEKWLNISDEKFSWGDLGYQAVLGGITGALFSTPSDVSFIRQARKAGAEVYAKGEAAVKSKIDEGLIEVAALKERGLNNDAVQLADAALGRLMTDEKLDQRTKEYYLGLAEQMVMRAELAEQYNALAKDLTEKAKADPTFAKTLADEFNAIVNEAGGEGKYTSADFQNEKSDASRVYVVAQMASDWLSRSDADTAIEDIMTRKAALYQGTEEQKTAIRSMEDGSTVAFRVGDNAYAVVTKRAGTNTYSVGYTTPGQVESDGTVVATHNLTAEKVEEMLAKPMTEQGIDAQIAENAEKKAEAENKKTEKKSEPAEKKQTEKPKRKTAEKKSESKETAPAKPVSEEAKKENEEIMRYRKYEEIRKEHPDSVVAMRRGNFYIVYGNDATEIAKRTQLKLLKLSVDGELVPSVAIPYEDAQTYFDYIEGKAGDVIVVTPNGEVQNRAITAPKKPKAETTEKPVEKPTAETKEKPTPKPKPKADQRRLGLALRRAATQVLNMWKKDSAHFPLSIAVEKDGKYYLTGKYFALVMNGETDFLYPAKIDVDIGGRNNSEIFGRDAAISSLKELGKVERAGGIFDRIQNAIDGATSVKANAEDVLNAVNNGDGKGVEIYDGKGKAKKVGFVKIDGVSFNQDYVRTVLSAIENPTLFIGKMDKSPCLVIKGDNGSGMVLPMRISGYGEIVAEKIEAIGYVYTDGSKSISYSPATIVTEQTAKQEQTAQKVKPEDLSDVEARLTSAFGIDGSEFTKEEWAKARECVPNIDGLNRKEQARVLTLVRTAQAHGVNEDYMKGLARLSSVYGFGVVFEDIDVSGFYSRKHGMVVINPNNLDETYGHEIEHSFDQIVKEGKAEFRTDLSEKVRKIVGASVFDKAKAQYKEDYDKLRARDGAIREMSDAELEAEATANVVGKYLSNMTLLKKLAASDYKLGRGLLAAIRRMKDKWTIAKAFAKENDSTAFAEYRKMTQIEKLLMQELAKRDARKAGDTAYSPATVTPSVLPAGDTSSAAFKRWFGNSPFKNEDGTPKVYYHGAKKGGGFTVFRDWQYFTDKKKYAERYAKYNPNALYEVYLTADKVFNTRNADARKIFQSIRDEYGLSELQDTGLPDWTDGYDITEYLSEHPELGYDAVILDEGGDLVDGEPVSRGESIIIKDSAQVKSATDNIGTYDKANPDIRYSPVSPSTNAEYMQLAQEPKKNESRLRELVKEAAEKAGYTIKAYHGTNADFTTFDASYIGGDNKLGNGFYFSTTGLEFNYKNVIEAYLSVHNPMTDGSKKVSKSQWTELCNRFGTNVELREDDIGNYVAVSNKANRTLLDTENNKMSDFLFAANEILGVDGIVSKNRGLTVVFNSSQIKSADPVTYDDSGNIIPLSERFNTQNNDIRFSPRLDEPPMRVLTRAQKSRPSIPERFTNAKGMLTRQGFRAALKNAGSGRESFLILAVNAQQAVENQLVRAGMTKRQAAAWSQWARTGRSHGLNAVDFALADMTGKVRARGIMEIIEPFLAEKGEVYDAIDENGNTVPSTAKGGELAGKKYKDLNNYLGYLNAIDRENAGKNPYSDLTVEQMQKYVEFYEKKYPGFKKVSEELSAYNAAVLDIQAQAGMISEELAAQLKEKYPHYIPMRTMDTTGVGKGAVKGSNNLEIKRGLKSATESNNQRDDLIRNYIEQVQSRIKAAKLNMLAMELYETADGVNVIRAEDSQARAKELRQMERDFLEDPDKMPDPSELFRKFKYGNETRNEITFYNNGKLTTMAVSDRIYTGFSDLGGIAATESNFWVVKAMKKANDTFKKLVTNWNPFFGIKNIARDLQDGTLQTRHGFAEFLNEYRKNAQMMATGKFNDLWTEFLANGGLEASLFSDEFGTFTKGNKAGLEQAQGVLGQFQRIKNFNTLTEALPRFTEYCLTRKHGGTVQTALLNAADVTVNFGRSGKLTRILNSTVSPFLNPAVQGLDRVVRLFTEEGLKNNKALASLLVKAVLLGILPMALSNFMYGDDDEYKDMQDNTKENNYLFKVGNTWLRLPRGRVVSTISGLYNRSYKELMGEDVDWKDYGKNVLDQITPAQNVARHIASPFMDVANNKTWYGSAIESQSLQNYAVKERYDENTSRISVWIGQFTSHFGLSPKKVNYLLDQYTGVIGDILLPTTTPAGTRGVVSYNFTVDPNTSSNLSDRFYKLYNETMYASNGGDEEAYYLKRRLDETKSAASELFKEIKTINADSSLSNKEKVKQASAIRAMINQLYKTALQDAKGYSANVKDALAIKNSYGVVQITQSNARQYGLTAADAGKYAVTFGDQAVKLYGSEKEATEYNGDTSKKTIYAEANRLTYGSEYALREYNVNVYEKAQKLNELGISYDEYYNFYMTARYYSGKDKKQKILAYLNGSGMSKSQIALMMYYSGYSAYADEAKKAIKASSLSAERKKELLAGITD